MTSDKAPGGGGEGASLGKGSPISHDTERFD